MTQPDRKTLFFRGLFSGYGAIVAQLIFTAVSVPLCLIYLSKEEFGLWAVVLQLGNFLLLMDLGMSSSVARFLANHKDSVDGVEYANVLKTGGRIFFFQAFFLLSLAIAAAWILPALLDLPPTLVFEFRKLVFLQGVILALGLSMRARISPLWAHQRIDVTHLGTTSALLSSLVTMAVGLFGGVGLDSLWISSFVGSLFNNFVQWIACQKLRLYPTNKKSGSFQKDLFLRMLRYARDVFLIHLGGLLCQGSQIIIITKTLGLETAALFSVVTKTFILGQQGIGRFIESSAPGLTEIYVRGDRARLADRFYKITLFSAAAATICAVAIGSLNRSLISVWTQETMTWNLWGDFLLGALLIVSVTSRCFHGAFLITTELYRVRLLPILEGFVFISLAYYLAPFWGLNGILLISLCCHFFITLSYYAKQIKTVLPDLHFWFYFPFIIPFTYTTSCVFIYIWSSLFSGLFLVIIFTLLSLLFSFLMLRFFQKMAFPRVFSLP